MSQLITTTDVSTIRPVFTQGFAENIKRYNQLKTLFSAGKEYRIFANPIPGVGGSQKIAWHTEYEGKMIPFSKLSAQDKELVKGQLKYQINKLYHNVIKNYNANQKGVNELFGLLDSCIEIPDYNDVYVINAPSGETNFCIIRWGFTSDDHNAQSGLIKKLVPIKVNTIPIKAVFSNEKSAVNEKITVKYLEKEFTAITDAEGKIYLQDVPFFTKIDAYQIDANIGEKINLHSYVCDARDEYIFRIGIPNQDMNFKIVDNKGRPLKNTPIYFDYQGNKIQKYTDEFGNITLKDIPVGTEINCIQNQNIQQKFVCEKDIFDYTMIGEGPKTNMIFKVVDPDKNAVAGIKVVLTYEKNTHELISDAKGNIYFADVQLEDTVSCEPIVDGEKLAPISFVCEKNIPEYIIEIPFAKANMLFKVLDADNKIVANANVIFTWNGTQILRTADQNGQITLENIKYGDQVIAEQTIDGQKLASQNFTFLKNTPIYIIKGEQFARANMLFKVLDADNKIVANANVIFTWNGTQILRTADQDGQITLENIKYGDQVTAEQTIDGQKLAPQNFTFSKTIPEYIIRGQQLVNSGTMNILLQDENKKSIPNADVRIEIDGKILDLKTDENGKIVLNNVKHGTNLKCRQMVDGVAKHQHLLIYEKGKTDYVMLGSLPKPLSKYANIQILVVNQQDEPIKNLKITLNNGSQTINQYSDDEGKTTFNAINCSNQVSILAEHQNTKKEIKFYCQNETEFHKIVIGKKRFWWLWWLIPLLLLLGLLFYFVICPIIMSPIIHDDDTTDTIKIDTIVPKPDSIPIVKGLKVIVLEDSTNYPVANAEVKLIYNKDTLTGKTNAKGEIIFDKVPEDNALSINATVNATGYKELIAKFYFVKERIFYISNKSRDISDVVLPCGQDINSQGKGSTIRMINVKKASGKLTIIFDMFEIPDEIIVYNGKIDDIAADKVIWRSKGYVKRLHQNVFFDFNSPDSIITVQINGGDEKKTEWYFRVLCP